MLMKADSSTVRSILNSMIIAVTGAIFIVIYHQKSIVEFNYNPTPLTFRRIEVSDKQLRDAIARFGNTSHDCPHLHPPDLDLHSDYWQNITTGGDLRVFSAYIDGGNIRAIGAGRRDWTVPVYCQVWTYVKGGPGEAGIMIDLQIVTGRVDKIDEHHGMRFGAMFYICPIRRRVVPYSVSIVTNEPCGRPTNVIKIRETSSKRFTFAVCVKPMFEFDDTHRLVEFIELSRILGAEYFLLYARSMGPNVRRVLDLYAREDLVEVVPWDFNMALDLILEWAGIAARNDCIYRLRGVAKYVVNPDFDEFILPREEGTRTWTDLLINLPEKGVYIFRNSFFDRNWQNSSASYPGFDIAHTYHLLTLLKLYREKEIYPPLVRSKLIVNPFAVDAIGTHEVLKIRNTWTSYTVDPSIALSHHYRYWKNNGVKVKDSTILKYRDQLIRNVNNRWNLIER